jgi:diadenosine tetraphosphate (Ap4A) HIT family hydrolase
VPEGCLACDIVARRREVLGGILFESEHFLLHVLADPSPIPGWVVLTSKAHARAVYSLSTDALSELGPLMARVMNAQLAALRAEHVYSIALGDVLEHCHVHLIPRMKDTPAHLRGRGAFSGAANEMRSENELLEAAMRVRARLA